MKRLMGVSVASLLLLGACASQTATASFRGVSMPVLLGPVDRIGGGEPLSVIGEETFAGRASQYEATSSRQSSNTIGNTTYTKTTTTHSSGATGAGFLATKLALEYDFRPNWDLRLERVRARTESSGLLLAIFGAGYQTTDVVVSGAVVAVKRGK